MSRSVRSLAVTLVLLTGAAPWSSAGASGLTPLPAPRSISSFITPALPSEGAWAPEGRRVHGVPAIYTTFLRPPQNTGVRAGVAWIDPRLLRATLYSGSLSPGGYFWKLTAPVSRAASQSLVAAFNGGFLLKDSHGGYFSEHHLVSALVPGAASLALYRDGTMALGAWGRDLSMTPAVVAVRQNLTLLVDHGAPVAGLNRYDIAAWGFALNKVVDTPRSALGVTASGAFVYVEGPMNVTDLARLLVRVGAVRGMVLDMNPLWPIFATYTPASPTGYASAGNGRDLTTSMLQTPARFFAPAYSRDFITLSSR